MRVRDHRHCQCQLFAQVLKHAFDIVFAFDEAIVETVLIADVRHIMEMCSKLLSSRTLVLDRS